MKKFKFILISLCFYFNGFLSASDIVKFTVLTDKIFVLQFDDGYIQHYGYHQNASQSKVFLSPLDELMASKTQSYTIISPDDPDFKNPVNPIKVGRKSMVNDISNDCQWNGQNCMCDYIKEHTVYLYMPFEIKKGKTYIIKTGNLASNKKADTLKYELFRTMSPAIHINQAGFIPDAAVKYAYISHWMGDAGPLNLEYIQGNKFYLFDYINNKVAYTGNIKKRADLHTSPPDGTKIESKLFSGAGVWECDFSDFKTPGRYVLSVEKLGCSYPFTIETDIYREAFYHTARQLYHNRSGIALEAQYTQHTRPRTCHVADGKINLKYSTSRWIDWKGASRESGDSAEVFSKIINFRPNCWGWYQDAGDWDGYYSHFNVPRNLLTTFELAKDNFKDGELNIPESNNGIPDILDEACWLVNYFNRCKGHTGGVAGARVYPDLDGSKHTELSGIPSWEDDRIWIVSGEDPVTSYTFAGLAIQMAYSYELVGLKKYSQALLDSAMKAYNWAEKNSSNTDLVNSKLYALSWLYKYTGEGKYQSQFIVELKKPSLTIDDNYAWAIWAYITNNRKSIDKKLKEQLMKEVCLKADIDIVEPAINRSMRVGYDRTRNTYVATGSTPMVVSAMVAYKVSKDTKYLKAIQTTCDYFLGGNPMNMLWMTGYGFQRPMQVLHIDSWYRQDPLPEMSPGIVPYGIATESWINNNGPWSALYMQDRIYPDKSQWPTHELWCNNRYSPPSNEFTVHQNSAVAAAVYGFLCSAQKRKINSMPMVRITAQETDQGIMIQSQAKDNDGKLFNVEIYCNEHKLTETSNEMFSFLIKTKEKGNYKIKAIAYDDQAGRSYSNIIDLMLK